MTRTFQKRRFSKRSMEFAHANDSLFYFIFLASLESWRKCESLGVTEKGQGVRSESGDNRDDDALRHGIS